MLRRNSTGRRPATSSSAIETAPEVGSTMRLIIRSKVVLPDPDDPTSTVVLREGSTRLKSSTARVPSGKDLETCANSIMAPRADRSVDDLDSLPAGDDHGGVLYDAVDRRRVRLGVGPTGGRKNGMEG